MKQTGPTKKSKRDLIRQLEKESISRKEEIWKTISKVLQKPSRNQTNVNVGKLALLSKKFPKKTLVVCGKVLGTGIIDTPVSVAGSEFSESAVKKIEAAKGKAVTLVELIGSKQKVSELILVK